VLKEGKMSIPTLEGITAKTIATERINTRVLFSGPDDATPVLFLHGNTSNATWWEEVMVTLPPGFRGIAPDQRGFGEADPEKKIDATRGMGDFADDAVALLDHLKIDKAHIVGSSLGGNIVWYLMIYHPERFLSTVQVDPGSPYGFGATKDVDGTPCFDDYAGSGGGLANPELIERLEKGDRSLESQFSPRAALRTLIVKPPFIPEREEELLSAMLSIHLGPERNPGDAEQTANWPFVAPGKWGAANALSPKYAPDVNELYAAEPKTTVLWIRGGDDLIISDTSASDPGFLGMMEFIPGWPGQEVYPPQPMLGQTRAVLEKYAAAGGTYSEVVIEDAAHAPYLDKLEDFNRAFHAHLHGS
jgi:pimeloyl-ACP methyl ester carboxylesterase